MEIDDQNDNKKKRNSETTDTETKKIKTFSAKEFRKNLNTENKVAALENFLHVIKTDKQHDYVADYLQCGGNCLELLQILELDSGIAPSLIFNILNRILLKIIKNHPEQQQSSLEACQYLLRNYVPVLNKMLGLSSSAQERCAALGLLATLVTFSPLLAKDILLNISFHQTNLELLTKHTPDRKHFIHFVTSFLVQGHYPTLALFLEKKFILSSIIKGLQYDIADTVCLALTAMQNNILENVLVSKTVKMNTFNTLVVRDIVNLYNWKGPEGLNKKNVHIEVDKYEKSKVSESVHAFLLVLCTSHRFGVIFRDPTIGLSQKHCNSLMYTVVQSLERPWEHSYASQLVTEICISCPDLVKSMWNVLMPSLELRPTENWLMAVEFSRNLIDKLQPACIEVHVKNLTVSQICHVIGMLVAPTTILKQIFPENADLQQDIIKQNVFSLLRHMLRAVNLFLNAAKSWLNNDDYNKLKTLLNSYIQKHFPDSEIILLHLEIKDNATNSDYLSCIFDVCNYYQVLCPQHLDNLISINLNLPDLLDKVDLNVQLKIINTFFDVNSSLFSVNTQLFSIITPKLLKFYHETRNDDCFNVIKRFLLQTGIFEGWNDEINIWINAVLNLNNLNDDFLNTLLTIFIQTSEKQLEYLKIWQTDDESNELVHNTKEILDNLLFSDDENESKSRIYVEKCVLSPMIIGFFEYLQNNEYSKDIKVYIQFVLLNLFHSQTNFSSFQMLLNKYRTLFPKNLKNYIKKWTENEVCAIENVKNHLEIFCKFSENFLNGDIGDFKENLDLYSGLKLNLLQCGVFYLSHMDNISEQHIKNCENFIKNNLNDFSERDLRIILCNSNLTLKFSLLHLHKLNMNSLITKFLINIVKELQKSERNIDIYLNLYREKIVKTIIRLFKKPKKYEKIEQFRDILEIFHLNNNQIMQTANYFHLLTNSCIENRTIYEIVVYCIGQVAKLNENTSDFQPFSEESIENIVKYSIEMNVCQKFNTNTLSMALYNYLKIFPHQIKHFNNDFIDSIIKFNDVLKENVLIFTFLLEKKSLDLKETVKNNLDTICEKKGLILPILDVIINIKEYEDLFESIYDKINGLIMKILQRPHKAGQYFINNYNGIAELVFKFMPLEICEKYVEKIQKSDLIEVFYVKILEKIFKRILNEEKINAKHFNNILLTFIHFQVNLFKKNDDSIKIQQVSVIFNDILDIILLKTGDFNTTTSNETFQTYCKFCLKFGVSGNRLLLTILTKLIRILSENLQFNDGQLLLTMLLSHSEFLDKILPIQSDCKLEILQLFHTICEKWNDLMERQHIPLLLSSYNATISKRDRIILSLLKLYENRVDRTHFYDFKPFLWGQTAANHYSVRSNLENVLRRQPKMLDVLNILDIKHINTTIKKYPLKNTLNIDLDCESIDDDAFVYDLAFLLPLFSQLLASENQVQTYHFSRSGALSLTVLGLSSYDEGIRQASCHILSRFYFHLEGKHTGKDNLLWIRFVEAICKGVAVLPNFTLNNFSAIFLSRMALILTNPTHDMYIPLAQYLTAKLTLNFNTIPELYTFLHSSDVNYVQHRKFLFEILLNGLRTVKDFKDFEKSMAFKLFSELYSSCLSNNDNKLFILDIINAVCRIKFGVKILYENHSILTQLYSILITIDCEYIEFFDKFISILNNIVQHIDTKHCFYSIFNMLEEIMKTSLFSIKNNETLNVFYKILYTIFRKYPHLINNDVLILLLNKSSDNYCKYIYNYGCNFVDKHFTNDLHLLFYDYFNNGAFAKISTEQNS